MLSLALCPGSGLQFVSLSLWVQGNDAQVWGFTTMPDKTLRNVRGLLFNKKEA